MSVLHREQSGEQVHVIHFKEYADAAARESDISLDATHVHKIALQLNDGSFWRLVEGGGSPVWHAFSGVRIGSGMNEVPTNNVIQSMVSKPQAQQSIVKAAVGSRPSGWTASDCDPPVASMTYSGGIVTIAAGLQVACAGGGAVLLSAVSTATQDVDLSGEPDAKYHIAVNVNADGSFGAPSYSAVAPEVGLERINAGADLHNPAAVTHVNGSDAPIRRVYLGWAIVASGVITSLHCFALGSSVTIPANGGALCFDDTDYAFSTPFPATKATKGYASVKFSDGQFHPVVTHYMTGSSVSVGAVVGVKGGLGVLSVPNILANARTAPTSQGGATVDDSGYISITMERGY
ncbi:hypothetical protein N1030_01675 [Desulfovibrio mangrovi]|uniref:hypothetical protein n=1 Tax=Desulfovibrio mangrovi TaxID=2976983 RepID=UPI0022462D2D|nr:hypothetical protein [Desulfovibrio mangrovi]UZP67704.1 hypothetical protein N1030_01675 [Desulfovibrio mangrovi]